MRLSQPEIIQILRRRAEMNQGTLGAEAFETSFESGRTKIKNIELGRQKPTRDDLKKIADVLGVAVSELVPGALPVLPDGSASTGGVCLRLEVIELIPGAEAYIDMLNKAVQLDDRELMAHIAEKLSSLFLTLTASRAAKH